MQIIRKHYINLLWSWKDHNLIKVITGVRRCGKSTILQQYKRHLIQDKTINSNQIIYKEFTENNWGIYSAKEIYDDIISKAQIKKVNYVLLDEVQEIANFEKMVISLYENKKYKFDIYLTGSNSRMFSSELATLFTGRNVEIHVLPFSFAEFYSFAKKIYKKMDIIDIFLNKYLKFGGLPILTSLLRKHGEANIFPLLKNTLNDIVQKDIKKRNHLRNVIEFDKVLQYVYQNVGQVISTRNIANTLKSINKIVISHKTVNKYLTYINESILCYRTHFYNINGKKILDASDKHYAVDLGFRNACTSNAFQINHGLQLENVVYLELLRRGYDVTIGKIRSNREIDFIAIKSNETHYFQVTEKITNNNIKSEIGNLESIKDNYPKTIISLYDLNSVTTTGIKIVRLTDWLLEVSV